MADGRQGGSFSAKSKPSTPLTLNPVDSSIPGVAYNQHNRPAHERQELNLPKPGGAIHAYRLAIDNTTATPRDASMPPASSRAVQAGLDSGFTGALAELCPTCRAETVLGRLAAAAWGRAVASVLLWLPWAFSTALLAIIVEPQRPSLHLILVNKLSGPRGALAGLSAGLRWHFKAVVTQCYLGMGGEVDCSCVRGLLFALTLRSAARISAISPRGC